MTRPRFAVGAAVVVPLLAQAGATAADPLPSWNATRTKAAVVAFGGRDPAAGSPDFVPSADRVAVFESDGTLWCEQPVYAQVAFALARVEAPAPKHPEWWKTRPFEAALEGNHEALAAAGENELAEIVSATHSGMTMGKFEATAADWLAAAEHPRCRRPYVECVYQPMLELLA